MARPEDVRVKKKIRSECNRHMIDITGLDLQVLHGVAYIRGVVRAIKGGPLDTKEEVGLILRHLKQKGTISDYIIDAIFRDV